jgi:hypothetical protein
MHEVTPTRPHMLTQPFLWCMRRLAGAYVFLNRTSEEKLGFKCPFLKMDAQGHDVRVALGAGNFPYLIETDCIMFRGK